ncbi:MAG TPA: efflux RND transporter periplasmic adaptor subunit [Longimicrobiales bacterium]|nr:efflux RND transporter periplasmic adaptor subunit [Longimicrobiales bacterium]
MRRTIMLLAATLAFNACGGADDTQEDATTSPQALLLQPADIAVVEASSLAGGIVLSGTLLPERTVELRAQVPGVVTRLAVDRGDAVGAGQLVAVIEAEGIRSAAAGAQAMVSAAQANVALARQRYESSRRLYERGAISQIDLQTAEAAYEAAQGQLAAARAQSSSASESARRATVTSPIAGVVSDRMISQGEAVNPGQALVTIVNTTALELAGQVPVQAAARVARGQKVEFTLDAYPGQSFEGTVSRVDPTADPATRQVGVYLRLPNPNRRIVGGVFATGRVLSDVATSVLVVPESAVRTEGTDTFVWLIVENRLTRRPVVIGARDMSTGMLEVVSGLAAGDRVLNAPGTVQEGAPVRFSNDGGAAAPAEAGR